MKDIGTHRNWFYQEHLKIKKKNKRQMIYIDSMESIWYRLLWLYTCILIFVEILPQMIFLKLMGDLNEVHFFTILL